MWQQGRRANLTPSNYSPQQRVEEFLYNHLSVRNGKLFRIACRERFPVKNWWFPIIMGALSTTEITGESVPVELTTRGPRGKFIVGAPEIMTPRTFSIEMDLSGKLMKQQCWEAQRTKNLKSGCTKLIDLVEDYRITHMFLYSCSQGLHQPCTNNRRSADEQCQLHIFSGGSPNK